jgi:hypothetical protein
MSYATHDRPLTWGGTGFNPMELYGPTNVPPLEQQRGFFHFALREAQIIAGAVRGRIVRGPFYLQFQGALKPTHTEMVALHPNFTGEHLMPYGYQSETVHRQIGALSEDEKDVLEALGKRRTAAIDELAETTTVPALKDQTIEPGVLSQPPPYCYQGDGWRDHNSFKSCFMAAFRMVFAGVTGWQPHEAAVGKEAVSLYGTHTLRDGQYLSVFSTDIFSEVSDREVRVREFMGSDLDSIETFAKKLKARYSEADIFTIVSLASENGGDKTIWHTNVLLDADESSVRVLDPVRNQIYGPRLIDKQSFANRWATALNRGHFIIALPPQEPSSLSS